MVGLHLTRHLHYTLLPSHILHYTSFTTIYHTHAPLVSYSWWMLALSLCVYCVASYVYIPCLFVCVSVSFLVDSLSAVCLCGCVHGCLCSNLLLCLPMFRVCLVACWSGLSLWLFACISLWDWSVVAGCVCLFTFVSLFCLGVCLVFVYFLQPVIQYISY